jgi:hypothetical protein
MVSFRQLWFLQRNSRLLQSIVPALIGCALLCASCLSWLKEPLGSIYTAWELPIDIGWQLRVGFLNYGLLCTVIALYAWLVAWANWKPFRGYERFLQGHSMVGILCILPVVLFVLQYLCADIQAMTLLARHKTQVLLIEQHFGYRVTDPLIELDPQALDASTLNERLQLLVDQAGIGLLVPCICAWAALDYRRLFKLVPSSTTTIRCSRLMIALFVFLIALLGRAPVALICENEGRVSLASGNYVSALNWFAAAQFFNPQLEQTAFFHRERGEAQYFLAPQHLNDDSRLYLAAVYREQGAYLDAYQQMLSVWSLQPTATWTVEEMSVTLEQLVEATRPLYGPPEQRVKRNTHVLPWLQLLARVDPTGIYSPYLTGRIAYELHNYTTGVQLMAQVLRLSSDTDVASSAYTYAALSQAGLANHKEARMLLLKAVLLDPNYRNNTAREELSGLH